MNLDWKNAGYGSKPYEADLPPIPGYTDEPGDATVFIRDIGNIPIDDDYNPGSYIPGPNYSFLIVLPYHGGTLSFNANHFDVPQIGEWYDEGDCEWEASVADVMDYVEQCLDPEVIADALKAYGYPPDED